MIIINRKIMWLTIATMNFTALIFLKNTLLSANEITRITCII